MKKLLLLFVVSFSTITFGQDRFEKIDSLLTYLNGNDKFMGSLTIREGEYVVFSKAYGFADVEKGIRTTLKSKSFSIANSFIICLDASMVSFE